MSSLIRLIRSIMTALLALSAAATVPAASAATYSSLTIVGNHFVTSGKTVRLLGVQQQGLEYMCLYTPDPLFDSTHDQATIDVWKSWHVNTVRLPINESCWLGQLGVKSKTATYRAQVLAWVQQIRASGIFVILDNHVATDGSGPATDILPMADGRAATMWASVAQTFKSIPGVAFDMYNEPNHISWKCWRDGCWIPQNTWLNKRGYSAIGMQRMVNAVRGQNATNPILLGGIDWSNDNSAWLQWKPTDKYNQLFVDQHVYGPSNDDRTAPCDAACRTVVGGLAATVPVLTGEMGEIDCRHDYIDGYMTWADAHGVGYLGETWNATSPGGYVCEDPVLLKDFNYPNPTPTPYGIGFRDHLRSIDTAPH